MEQNSLSTKKTGGIVEKKPGDYYNAKVLKTIEKDGWTFPAQMISITNYKHEKIVVRRRATIVEDSLVINGKLALDVFKAKIPVGAGLLNNIEQVSYTVTELDPMVDGDSVNAKMDDYMKKSRRTPER